LGVITTGCFTLNIIYFFCRVYVGLAEDFTSPHGVIVFEATYAFVELVIRIFGSCLISASLCQETERTLSILMEFSNTKQTEGQFLVVSSIA